MAEQVIWSLTKRKSKTENIVPNPTLVEVHEWVQPSHCHHLQHDNNMLQHGQLLRWMDITACLSAERHAKHPCVTVSVDDISFDRTVSVGHVVILRAVVNRAFTSSLEVGLSVESEDPLTGKREHVCKAYSVFVAKPKDGSKVKLPPVALNSEEENREYLLAAERRRMRTTYAKDMQRVVKSLHLDDDEAANSPVAKKVKVSETQVHTINIVLPVHANHHGTTFGGQIMEWMTDVATISAMRLSRSLLVLEGIESVHFRGPSHVGERVSLSSSVNKVFSTKRFEVGVRVEGYAVGEEKRHINSAFFTFRPADTDCQLPELVTDTKTEAERAASAVARHCLWLDRKAIQYDERPVSLNSENAYQLILKNTTMVMTNFSITDWKLLQSYSGFKVFKHETTGNLVFRIHDTLEGVTAKEAFKVLTDHPNRMQWDCLCKNCRVFRHISPDDKVIHIVMRSPQAGEKARDFVLLCSQREPQEYSSYHKYYYVAFSSVLSTDLPPLTDYERSQVISSGYVMEDCGAEGERKCTLTYLHQINSTVMAFFAKDLVGFSALVEKVYMGLRRRLLEGK